MTLVAHWTTLEDLFLIPFPGTVSKVVEGCNNAILEKVAHNWPFFLVFSVPHKLGYTTSKRTKETNRFQLCPAVLTVG
ncbi:MAG: hypothetical protein Ct9H90mP5_05480 [Acidimicrobiaceae bacterium]|nr:MAG: hypothetical protein Ct9H90mP5_05480 [Acidimicrobiaceae bacterium]